LTRCRTDHGGVAHRYLLNNECPECIPPNSNYTLKHILIICVDVVESRQTYYNVNNLSDFAYECRRRPHFKICRRNWFECYSIDKYIHSKYMVLSFEFFFFYLYIKHDCFIHRYVLFFKDFVVEKFSIYNLLRSRHSWNTAKIGIIHQSINQSFPRLQIVLVFLNCHVRPLT
jgi:hypothetical protein